jgi:hypothetical protein
MFGSLMFISDIACVELDVTLTGAPAGPETPGLPIGPCSKHKASAQVVTQYTFYCLYILYTDKMKRPAFESERYEIALQIDDVLVDQ